MLLHLVADFGVGDLAFAEVAQRLKRRLPQAELVLTAVPPFATLAAGFVSAQLSLNEAPPGTVVFHNVAPRRDDEGPRADNAGERLAAARLPGGGCVVGVNAGYAFSFFRQAGLELRYVRAEAAGSQFRSRDVFPDAVAAVARGEPGVLLGPVDPGAVPDVPEGRVAYVDGFGNLKTTWAAPSTFAPGSKVRVRVEGRERIAYASGGSFSVPAGTLAFAPGSSGWPLPGGGRVRFMELFLRGGSAAEAFGRPAVGAHVEVMSAAVPT
ncbi:MAG: SAM-dependent chlorinase/fluorinase [Deinococcales bacterium]